MVYYDNTGTAVGSDFLYSDCPDDTGGLGSGNGSSSGGGSSSGAGTEGAVSGVSPTAVLVVNPDKPISNIRQHLKCFTTSQDAKFTVYARQPQAGKSTTWSGFPPRVGHTFISITQNGITRVFGFYPTSPIALFDDAVGALGDDSQQSYSVKITTTISPTDLANLMNYIYLYSDDTYSLSSYNCTDFGIGAAGAAGLLLPDTYGSWGLSGGRTPGTLGQDMRNMALPAGATRSLSGTSPADAGGC